MTEELINMRADSALTTLEEISSRSQAQKLFELGYVTCNGKAIKPSLKLEAGQELSIQLPEDKPSELTPYHHPLKIYFEDEHIIVLEKEAGMVVHPAAGHEDKTLVNALLAHTKNLSMGFGEQRPGIVHRLDKDTSGLMVVAKNNESHVHLAEQFKEKTASRAYYALVFGEPKQKEGHWESFLSRHPTDRKKFASVKEHNSSIRLTKERVAEIDPEYLPKGKFAYTEYKVLKTSETGFSFLECRLKTGRTHQIRIHTSEAGHPVFADPVYGGLKRLNNIKEKKIARMGQAMGRIFLHAFELGLNHPKTGERMTFNSELPEELKKVYKEASLYDL